MCACPSYPHAGARIDGGSPPAAASRSAAPSHQHEEQLARLQLKCAPPSIVVPIYHVSPTTSIKNIIHTFVSLWLCPPYTGTAACTGTARVWKASRLLQMLYKWIPQVYSQFLCARNHGCKKLRTQDFNVEHTLTPGVAAIHVTRPLGGTPDRYSPGGS